MKTVKGRVAVIGGAVLAIGAVILILLLNSETAYRSISISEISGRVITENNGKSYEAYKNMVIGGGYTLTTEADSYTRMLLDSDKYMKLEEESSAHFESLGDAQNHRTAIRLDYGAMSTEITAPLGEDEEFVVNTPNAVMAVRGTFFRVAVSCDQNGDVYTDIYTFGGAVSCQRVLPDGTAVDENVMVDAGYKARIKMDEIITVYIEELIEGSPDSVDPLEMEDVSDGQLVEIYNASAHGHAMFKSLEELWNEILSREIDVENYTSVYDGGSIPSYAEAQATAPQTDDTSAAEETRTEKEESAESPESTSETDTDGSQTADTASAQPPTAVINEPEAAATDDRAAAEEPETAAATANATETAAEANAPETAVTAVNAPEQEATATRVPESSAEAASPPATEATNPTITTESTGNPQSTPASSEPLPHVHAASVEKSDATCTEAGYVREICTLCGEVISEEILPAAGHTAVTETIPPTCTTNGSVTVKCGTCATVISKETTYALGHDYEVIESIEATCTTEGKVTNQCKSCGKVSVWEYPALSHRIEIAKEVTETVNGVGDYAVTEYYCSMCSSLITKDPLYLSEENFPDPVFRKYVEENIDMDTDGRLGDAECGRVKIIRVDGMGIDTLEGIEYFYNLETLYCRSNNIEWLSLRNNENLKTLFCGSNNMRSIEYLGYCHNLQVLNCDDNQLVNLELYNLENLTSLSCADNVIEYLDLRSNPKLEFVNAGNNLLSCVDLSENKLLTTFRCSGNKLYINVNDDGEFDIQNVGVELDNITNVTGADYDAETGRISNITADKITYTYDCGRGFSMTVDLISETYAMNIDINEENFPDEVFRQYVIDNFDDGDGVLSTTECKRINNIDVSGTPYPSYTDGPSYSDGGVKSLVGIEYFAELEYLDCSYNSQLTSIDLSDNAALSVLRCYDTQISELDLSNNTELTELYCWGLQINELDVRNNTKLTNLWCDDTQISELYLNNNTALRELQCDVGKLDLSNNTALTHLYCCYAPIRELDLSNNTALSVLWCYETQIDELDLSNNTALIQLLCHNTQISKLDLSNNTALIQLSCHNTQISKLDLSNNTELRQLWCYETQISELDLRNNTALTELDCHNTPVSKLNISNNMDLTELNCSNTRISTLDVSNNAELGILNLEKTNIAYVDISKCKSISICVASGTHPITVTNGTFDTKTINGFDYTKVSNLNGAVMGENGVLTDIAEGAAITYTYDCGQGYSKAFTLAPDKNSTYAEQTASVYETRILEAEAEEFTAEASDENNENTLDAEDREMTEEAEAPVTDAENQTSADSEGSADQGENDNADGEGSFSEGGEEFTAEDIGADNAENSLDTDNREMTEEAETPATDAEYRTDGDLTGSAIQSGGVSLNDGSEQLITEDFGSDDAETSLDTEYGEMTEQADAAVTDFPTETGEDLNGSAVRSYGGLSGYSEAFQSVPA
ncbi:MAG: FecR domain-containing protein [Firmicutes bacterium]|nr:FecR domain-containing protein [[Eubacterium] siraeum]MCM1488140.1 FecR domain-containing protein [Bacillota bacterium]